MSNIGFSDTLLYPIDPEYPFEGLIINHFGGFSAGIIILIFKPYRVEEV